MDSTNNKYSLYNTCRTCLKNVTNEFIVPIFEKNIFQIIDEFIFLNLNINKDDGLPQIMCNLCFGRICNVSTFRKTCLESKNILEKHFNNSIINNNIKIEPTFEGELNDYPSTFEYLNVADQNDNDSDSIQKTNFVSEVNQINDILNDNDAESSCESNNFEDHIDNEKNLAKNPPTLEYIDDELYTLIPSQRSSNAKLSVKGYTYHLRKKIAKENGDVYYWCCEQRRKRDNRCSATAISRVINNCDNKHRLTKLSEHCHPPNHVKPQLAVIRSNLKRDAMDAGLTPKLLIDTLRESVSQEIEQNLPSVKALRLIIKRERRSKKIHRKNS